MNIERHSVGKGFVLGAGMWSATGEAAVLKKRSAGILLYR